MDNKYFFMLILDKVRLTNGYTSLAVLGYDQPGLEPTAVGRNRYKQPLFHNFQQKNKGWVEFSGRKLK